MMAAVMETHVQISDDTERQIAVRESEEEEEEDGGGSDEEEEEGEEADEEEDEDASDEEEGGAEDKAVADGDGNPNAGWAEAMAKILGKKTAESESVILMKNRELEKRREKEQQEQLERKQQVDQRRAWEMMCRVKPDVVTDRQTERALQRVATRGVVQLFNAVRKHQQKVDLKVKEVHGSERKKAKLLSSVSKKDFIDVLRRTEGNQSSQPAASEEKPSWSVLREDFMMGASMKDWDRLSDEEGRTKEGALLSDSV